MRDSKKIMSAEQARAAMEEALTRLERTLLSRAAQGVTTSGEQAVYIERLESENKQMSRDLAEMKKHCVALKNGYESLEKKCQNLADANDSAEKELAITLRDLDQLIAQKSLH
ncbi:MAG: hypothetical protein COA93_10775 [Alphaproteobacteria bacterium]|nr:MAG: hypothetical protein COA93_10775 [Alphaproteobacteria bacterium]